MLHSSFERELASFQTQRLTEVLLFGLEETCPAVAPHVCVCEHVPLCGMLDVLLLGVALQGLRVQRYLNSTPWTICGVQV